MLNGGIAVERGFFASGIPDEPLKLIIRMFMTSTSVALPRKRKSLSIKGLYLSCRKDQFIHQKPHHQSATISRIHDTKTQKITTPIPTHLLLQISKISPSKSPQPTLNKTKHDYTRRLSTWWSRSSSRSSNSNMLLRNSTTRSRTSHQLSHPYPNVVLIARTSFPSS